MEKRAHDGPKKWCSTGQFTMCGTGCENQRQRHKEKVSSDEMAEGKIIPRVLVFSPCMKQLATEEARSEKSLWTHFPLCGVCGVCVVKSQAIGPSSNGSQKISLFVYHKEMTLVTSQQAGHYSKHPWQVDCDDGGRKRTNWFAAIMS